MKSAITFCVFLFLALTLAQPHGEHYTDVYDNVNLDEILNNKRLLVAYINCILDKGKCTADGKELKGNVKDALENECSKCTEKQKQGTERVIGHLVKHEPESWNLLVEKYDPERKYSHRYEHHLTRVSA